MSNGTTNTTEIVTMEDGRQLQFTGRKRMHKESNIVDGQVITSLAFKNGRVIAFTIPEEMVLRFAAHGSEQKLGDATSGLDDVEDAILAVEKVIDQINAGDWNALRKAGDSMAGTSILARALVEVMGKPLDTIKQFLSTKTHAEKVALRGNSRVKPVIERLEGEKKSKGVKVDTDALLDELA